MTSEEFGNQWISFSMFNSSNKDGTTPNHSSLDVFERKLIENIEKTIEKKTKDLYQPAKNNLSDLEEYPLFL